MTFTLSKIPHLGRYKIAFWLPVIYGLYLFDGLKDLAFIIVLAGAYEIGVRQPYSNWSIVSLLHITGFFTIVFLPATEIWFLLIVVIANDVAAFYGEKYLNYFSWMKENIFHPISPNKTLGGLFYGIIIGSILGITAIYFLKLPSSYILLTLCICCIAVIGDLLNSKFKRNHKIKDSGEGLLTEKLLPGHGGIYDRFDAISLVCSVWFVFKFLEN